MAMLRVYFVRSVVENHRDALRRSRSRSQVRRISLQIIRFYSVCKEFVVSSDVGAIFFSWTKKKFFFFERRQKLFGVLKTDNSGWILKKGLNFVSLQLDSRKVQYGGVGVYKRFCLYVE